MMTQLKKGVKEKIVAAVLFSTAIIGLISHFTYENTFEADEYFLSCLFIGFPISMAILWGLKQFVKFARNAK